MAMGGRVFLDLHQENPAESCRCGRSIDVGIRLNDDTNKHEKEMRQSMTRIGQTTKTPVCSNGQWHVRVLKILYLAICSGRSTDGSKKHCQNRKEPWVCAPSSTAVASARKRHAGQRMLLPSITFDVLQSNLII